jgi:hypothetical protein
MLHAAAMAYPSAFSYSTSTPLTAAGLLLPLKLALLIILSFS